jgi:hypothetical protein
MCRAIWILLLPLVTALIAAGPAPVAKEAALSSNERGQHLNPFWTMTFSEPRDKPEHFPPFHVEVFAHSKTFMQGMAVMRRDQSG